MRPILRAWRTLAASDLLYKLIAFTALIPLVGVLLRLLIRRTGTAAVTDVDIALFFFTTWSGASALILVAALIIAITAIEQACLMTVALAALRGTRLRVRDGFAHGAAYSFAILRLTTMIVVRVIAIVAPFAAVLGLTYWTLLTGHDINFYLTDRPPSFWVALAIGVVVAAVLAAVLAQRALSWLLALPLVLFEQMLPIKAFAESTRRMAGHRQTAAVALAGWGALAIGLQIATTWGAQAIGRTIAPAFGGSLGRLLVFVACLALAWGAALLIVGAITAMLFAAIVVRAYDAGSGAAAARVPGPSPEAMTIAGQRWRVSWGRFAGGLAVAVVLATAATYLVMRSAWTDRPVTIFAHRGASAEAPENTLAAFRLAGDLGTDAVELDVQESLDGVVIVSHDSDLMKVGASALKIWDATAAELRAVDIGSRFAPRFQDERVPTLAEALEACKGRSRVNIELKYYGHNQRLEERVVEIVEAAGMEKDIVTMSLNSGMVAKMKRLRPEWTSGLLSAKAIGDLSGVPADFLAVEKAMATRRFIWAAHRAGKPVFVWTVNDPARMIRLIGLGVDGIITNHPDVAREVVDRYRRMTQAERLFLFVMTRLGAEEDLAPPDDDLRP